MTQSQARLERVGELTAAMEAAALEGDWETLEERLRERTGVLQLLLESVTEPDEGQQIGTAVEAILQRDQAIMELLSRVRQELNQQRGQLLSGRRALEGYFRT